MESWPLIVVQSRLESTRLPGKALYPVAGYPLIAFLLIRLMRAGLPGRVVLATTERPADDALQAWGESLGIDVVRGDVDNVLARYAKCLEQFPAAGVVRVTGDNPCIDLDTLRRCGDAIAAKQADYVVAYDGLPFGTGSDGYTAEAFARVLTRAKTAPQLEHLNKLVLDEPDMFTQLAIKPQASVHRPDVQFTIDTKEQWQQVARLLETPEPAKPEIPLAEVIARHDAFAQLTGD